MSLQMQQEPLKSIELNLWSAPKEGSLAKPDRQLPVFLDGGVSPLVVNTRPLLPKHV